MGDGGLLDRYFLDTVTELKSRIHTRKVIPSQVRCGSEGG